MMNKAVWGIRLFATALLGFVAASSALAEEARPMSVSEEWTSYKNEKDGLEIPALVVAPTKRGNYPATLFLHGRWGLTPEVKAELHRIAERGIVVMAPDYHFARAIPMLAWFTDKDVNDDIMAAVPHLQKMMGGDNKKKVGIIAQDYGGYFAIKAAAKFKDSIGALVGYYPLSNNPQSPKPRHIYGYMAEVDKVKAPTLLMIGAEDREMRRIATGRVAGRLKQLKTPIIHVEYPGADRCFDWRTGSGNFADGLARVDSLNRVAEFFKTHLGGSGLMVLSPDGWQLI